MHSNAMRWLGRTRGPRGGARAFPFPNNSRVLISRPYIGPNLTNTRVQASSPRRTLCGSSTSRAKEPPSSSSGCAPSLPPPSPNPAEAPNVPFQSPQWVFLGLLFVASAGTAYLYRRQSTSPDGDVINASTFTAFTITDREQVSPSAFIITLRPSAWVDPPELESRRVGQHDVLPGFPSARIREAWRHGLWSVEIKQPQLQIARHYTPLPPLSTSAHSPSIRSENPPGDGGGNADEAQAMASENSGQQGDDEQDWQEDLRILIRRLDGGEMSNYLSRQRVGDTIWLRGPHLGFDIPRRLGAGGDPDGNGEADGIGHQRGVVFLAGGTGIAPALQIAHKLLQDNAPNDNGRVQSRISILWANRWSADALGRDQAPSIQQKSDSWFRFWGGKEHGSSAHVQEGRKQPNGEPVSSLALQIRDLERRHPTQFDISYFIDNEGSFIKTHNVEAALAITASSGSSGARGPSSSSPSANASVNESCMWHSARAVELLPDDNDTSRCSASDPACACTCREKAAVETPPMRPGVNLVCVSGPDGFIGAYAGAKRWHDGNEMQGPVRGLLGAIRNDKGMKAGDWLVLKL
ncbi:putative fmi1 protein [Rosellinia necatrix]|uniref:Putative fmi1 protein n=1 Tax=Rosellinia necatrix TaxID=77044 RepID=A0A1W2TQN1_ROSNE|nr:putative fmi1 protein [Rosellinia necatrix]